MLFEMEHREQQPSVFVTVTFKSSLKPVSNLDVLGDYYYHFMAIIQDNLH